MIKAFYGSNSISIAKFMLIGLENYVNLRSLYIPVASMVFFVLNIGYVTLDARVLLKVQSI